MKKSKFIALVLGVLGVLLLGLGMCMCLIPEWDMFQLGVIIGCVGLIILSLMVVIYHKMENKSPVQINTKTLITLLLAITGVLGLGFGMSLVMVFEKLMLGIIIGIISILVLLCLIPFCKGLKKF